MRSIQNFCTCLISCHVWYLVLLSYFCVYCFIVTFAIMLYCVNFVFVVSLSHLISCYAVSRLLSCYTGTFVFVVSLPRLLTYAIVCCVILFHFCIYCFIVAFAILLHCVTFTFVASLSHLLSCYTVSLLPHEVTFCCRELCDMTFSRLQLWALLMQTATSFRSVLPPIVH